MRLAQVTDRVADRVANLSDKVVDLSEKYQVPAKLERASEKMSEGMSAASRAAQRAAMVAYRTALEHPRASAGGIILAAALVGGALWYVFGNWRKPAIQRRRHGTRLRAGTERRRRSRAARQAAA
jgi:hypothetical protein